MTSGAYVTSASLDALGRAILAYDYSAGLLDGEIGSAVDTAAQRLVRRRDELIRQAEQARFATLAAAREYESRRVDLASVPTDRHTSNERAALARAQDELADARRRQAEAEAKAERAKVIVGQVESAVSGWRGHRATWRSERSLLVGRAQAKLQAAGADLAHYQGVVASEAADAGAMSAGTSGGDASGTGLPGPVHAPGLPEGFALVPIAAIDRSDSRVHGTSDFRESYPAADLKWAVEKFFDIVLPTLASGGSRSDLVEADARAGFSGVRSLAHTYDGFLGNDSPVMSQLDDGRFEVTNGYHRIWCAQQLGYEQIPSRLL